MFDDIEDDHPDHPEYAPNSGVDFSKMYELLDQLQAEHERISNEENADLDQLKLAILPRDLRWKLHVAACSITDYTFWIYKCTDDGTYYKCFEIETGVSSEGVTPQEAFNNYYKQSGSDVLDLPRAGEEDAT